MPRPKLPEHPGRTLMRLHIEPFGLTVTEVADRLGVTRIMLSRIINGHAGISANMAVRLGMAFDAEPEFWLRAQAAYDLAKERRACRGMKIQRVA